ncbi:putative SCO1/SenC family protein [Candidatus Terasakiella magnetica]|uniref:Putative SCO1/SenC family protein n=1 Tax=Candidatus Terasakiella magnetica TaxID=1867952 RepID=A0A1C3RCC7_9PROT|nr:SCO family protein [Candidatus Terasakiella magnetica]SCA54872.1 putative SCO1/SenC family protein [Candidatus Terasakiella magnetica]
MMRNMVLAFLGFVFVLGLSVEALAAQTFKVPESEIDPEALRINEAKILGLKPKKGFSFLDQDGNAFTFRDRVGKPLVLVMSYYTCDGVCSSVNIELGERLLELENTGRIKPGKDFDVVTVSFDKNDTLETLNKFRKHVGLDKDVADGWTFAVASDADRERIKEFTDHYDYRFFWSSYDRTFYHPTVYMVLSKDMRLSRVLYAHDIEVSDIELAVLESHEGNFKPSEIINYAVSLCYSYSYKDGKYVFNIPMFVAFGSLILGVSALGTSVLAYKRRQRKKEG